MLPSFLIEEEFTVEGVGTAYVISLDHEYEDLPSIGDLPFARDVILHDCTMSPIHPATVHTHYDELRTLPPDVRKRLFLMHYGRIPAEIDPKKDGFAGALRRHEKLTISQHGVVSTHLRATS